MFHFFRIILLMFGKNLLYVIAKGMCVLIGVSFLLPFMSSFLSSFWTVLMWLSKNSESYLCSRNRCLSSLQSYLNSWDVVQICLILIAWMYEILTFNDFECSESIWRKLYRLYQLVFYIFWCKVCFFLYTFLYPEKKYWFLKFCTQIYLGLALCLIRLISK